MLSTSQPPPPWETCSWVGPGFSRDHSEERAASLSLCTRWVAWPPGCSAGRAFPAHTVLRLFTRPTTLELSFRKTIYTALSFICPSVTSFWLQVVCSRIWCNSHWLVTARRSVLYTETPTAHRPSQRHDYLIHSLLCNR